MKVWVLTFENVNFWDCNGVYSTKEKAIEALNRHYERCSDIWSNFDVDSEEETWISYCFYCQGCDGLIGVLIEEVEVDSF